MRWFAAAAIILCVISGEIYAGPNELSRCDEQNSIGEACLPNYPLRGIRDPYPGVEQKQTNIPFRDTAFKRDHDINVRSPEPVYVRIYCDPTKEDEDYETQVLVDPAQARALMDFNVKVLCQRAKPGAGRAPASLSSSDLRTTRIGLTPLFGVNRVGATAGSLLRTGAGIRADFVRYVRGLGGILRYQIMALGQIQGASIISSPYNLKHDLDLGVEIPFYWNIKFETLMGYHRAHFLTSTAPAFASYWLPQATFATKFNFAVFRKGVALGLKAAYSYVFPSRDSTREIFSGTKITAGLFSQGRLSKSWQSEWEMTYILNTQSTSDIKQSESLFLFGISLFWVD